MTKPLIIGKFFISVIIIILVTSTYALSGEVNLQKGFSQDKSVFAGDLPQESLLLAQAPQPPAQTPTPSPQPQPSRFSGPPVSFFFDDADIFDVAQSIFGDVLRVNYIIDPKVKGRVNFRTITAIPREEVLPVMEIIFRLNGIGIVQEQSLFRIVPLDDVSRELVYSQIGKEPGQVAINLFTFKNVNLRDSLKDIEHAIGLTLQGSVVRVMPIYRLNALLVIANSNSQLDYIGKWVQAFDRIFEGAKPTVYVYHVQNGKATDLASILQQIYLGAAPATRPVTTAPTQRPGTSPQQTATTTPQTQKPAITPTGQVSLVSDITRIFADETTNALIILATPEDYANIIETIKKLDIIPRQVIIETLIAEITLSDELRFGLEWSLKTDVKITNIKPFKRDVNLGGDVSYNTSALDPTKLTGFTFLAKDASGIVRAMLQTLASESKLNVIASPHILAADNREARIQIGDQVPVVTSETNVTGTTNIQRTIQYKDTGTILRVRPQINQGGLVSLEINQEVSDYTLKTMYGSEYPVIYKRETSTNVVVQDGETVIIGGLIKDKTDRTQEGLPLLSKIPILGYLFGYTANTNTRTELVILLTPRVVKDQQDAKAVTNEYLNRLKGVKEQVIEKEIRIQGTKKDKKEDKEE
ncbi:MAG: secretin N-terminal domain-containing protein [Thermodesulfovibrionales bacterium]